MSTVLSAMVQGKEMQHLHSDRRRGASIKLIL